MRAQRFNACLLLTAGFLVNLRQRVVYCETYKQFLARTLPEVCPYSTFCTTGPAKPFRYKKYSPCCKPCSCDKDCLITGNCCPDLPAVIKANQPIQPVAKCSSPVHYSYKNVTHTAIYHSGLESELSPYYIIYTCSKDYSNSEVIRKCVYPNRKLVPKEFVVVSDGRGYVFFNRYCAICNGVNTFIQWNLKLVCLSNYYKLSDVSDHQQLFDGKCYLLSSPPTSTIGWQSRCSSPYFSECNATRRWTKADSNIERACKSALYPYYDEMAPRTIIHKNPFCYICNGFGNDIRKLCQPDEMANTKGSDLIAFSGIIGVNYEPSVNTNARCLPSEVFDHHFARCRPLNCPLTLTPKNGKCVQIFRATSGLSIYIQIEVQFAYDNRDDAYTYLLNSKPEAFADFENVTLAIMEDIGMLKHPCISCPAEWLQRKDKTGVTVLVGYKSNGTCTAAAIIDTVNTWRQGLDKSSIFFATKNATQLMFYKELAYDIDSRNERTSAHRWNTFMLFALKYKECWSKVFLRPMFHCAFVDISPNEHNELHLRNISNVELSDFSSVKVNKKTVYRICLESYLPKESTSAMACLFQRVETVAMTFVALFTIMFNRNMI